MGPVRGLLQRVREHEPGVWSEVDKLVKSDPSMEAILASKHAALAALQMGAKICSTDRKAALPGCTNTVSKSTGCAHEVGQVFWLFDAPEPYPVEVFWNSDLPQSRLPHLHKSGFRGKHIGRILGQGHRFIKMIADNTVMTPFTAECVCSY